MRPRAWLGHLVGYIGEHKHQFRVYDPITKKVTVHRDVVFWENKEDTPKQGVEPYQPSPDTEDDKHISIIVNPITSTEPTNITELKTTLRNARKDAKLLRQQTTTFYYRQ
ncbi:hypothetical protein N7528_003103 [Penicillium herquei]|nr:hypothetical protein N7528_003103 [Penicillium herquei]